MKDRIGWGMGHGLDAARAAVAVAELLEDATVPWPEELPVTEVASWTVSQSSSCFRQ